MNCDKTEYNSYRLKVIIIQEGQYLIIKHKTNTAFRKLLQAPVYDCEIYLDSTSINFIQLKQSILKEEKTNPEH